MAPQARDGNLVSSGSPSYELALLPVPQLSRFEMVAEQDGRRLLLVPRLHPLRATVKDCIRNVYLEAFCGRGLAFPDMLIALLDGRARPLCAAGLRTAADGFFSEVYLDGPIDRVLSQQTRENIQRPAIFEVTTLASQSTEDSPCFIRQLGSLGRGAGFSWCFFTATARLRSLLCHPGA
jgi:hypothetical protein